MFYAKTVRTQAFRTFGQFNGHCFFLYKVRVKERNEGSNNKMIHRKKA